MNAEIAADGDRLSWATGGWGMIVAARDGWYLTHLRSSGERGFDRGRRRFVWKSSNHVTLFNRASARCDVSARSIAQSTPLVVACVRDDSSVYMRFGSCNNGVVAISSSLLTVAVWILRNGTKNKSAVDAFFGLVASSLSSTGWMFRVCRGFTENRRDVHTSNLVISGICSVFNLCLYSCWSQRNVAPGPGLIN